MNTDLRTQQSQFIARMVEAGKGVSDWNEQERAEAARLGFNVPVFSTCEKRVRISWKVL